MRKNYKLCNEEDIIVYHVLNRKEIIMSDMINEEVMDVEDVVEDIDFENDEFDGSEDSGNALLGVGLIGGAGILAGIGLKTAYDKWGKPLVGKAKAKIAEHKNKKAQAKLTGSNEVPENAEAQTEQTENVQE